MNESDLIHSPLCKEVERDGYAVRVEIYGTGKKDWILEVVDEEGNSTVWDDMFDTDEEASLEFDRTLEDEGIHVMVGNSG